MLVIDERNPRAVRLGARIAAHLEGAALDPALAIVVGGDGFLLRAVREQGPERTFLGINAGRIGFTLNDLPEPPDEAALARLAEDLAGRRYAVQEVPRLHVHGTRPDGSTVEDVALNDVYLERATGQTSHLRVWVDGVQMVDRMSCDGLIVATALGSTGYAFSAGASVCHPRLRLIHLTPICPHRPRLPPVALPPDAVVEVQSLDPERRPTRAVCDGFDHPTVVHLVVREDAQAIRLAWLPGHDATAAVIRKLLSP